MRCIAITGGIATGKSTVARLLVARGAVLVDADQVARQVVAPGQPALEEIRASFGADVLSDDGLNREAMAARVFADPENRRRLEAITHPRIREAMAVAISEAMSGDAAMVVVDIPLLYETGRDSEFPDVLLVYASPDVQRARLRERDGLGEAAIDARLEAQIPIEEKRSRARTGGATVIDNSGTGDETAAQIDHWWASVAGPSL